MLQRKKIIKALAILATFAPISALAQGIKNAGSRLSEAAGPTGLTEKADLGTVVGQAIRAALTLLGIIFLVLMVYAGYLWMTARGKEEQVTKARQIIIGSVIGLVVVVSAYAITAFITGQFGGF